MGNTGRATDVVVAQRPSLRRNIGWALFGNVGFAASQWAVLIVFAKLGTAAMLGQYALAVAVVMPILVWANLELRMLLATDARGRFAFRDYVAVRATSGVAALVAIMIAAVVGRNSTSELAIIAMVALGRIADGLSDVFYGWFQRRERMDVISSCQWTLGIGQVITGTILVRATHSTLAVVTGLAAVSMSVVGVCSLRRARLARNEYSSEPVAGASAAQAAAPLKALWSIVWLGLPMGTVAMLQTLASNLPRYTILSHLGETQVGVFAALSYLTLVTGHVSSAICASASPRLARLYASGETVAFRRLVVRIGSVALLLAAAGLIFAAALGRPVLALLYRPEYARHSGVLIWLMAACIPMYLTGVLGVSLNAMRRFHIQVPIAAMNAAVSFAASAFLIPRHGLIGAGEAIMAASVVNVALILPPVLHFARRPPDEPGAAPGVHLSASAAPIAVDLEQP